MLSSAVLVSVVPCTTWPRESAGALVLVKIPPAMPLMPVKVTTKPCFAASTAVLVVGSLHSYMRRNIGVAREGHYVALILLVASSDTIRETRMSSRACVHASDTVVTFAAGAADATGWAALTLVWVVWDCVDTPAEEVEAGLGDHIGTTANRLSKGNVIVDYTYQQKLFVPLRQKRRSQG